MCLIIFVCLNKIYMTGKNKSTQNLEVRRWGKNSGLLATLLKPAIFSLKLVCCM